MPKPVTRRPPGHLASFLGVCLAVSVVGAKLASAQTMGVTDGKQAWLVGVDGAVTPISGPLPATDASALPHSADYSVRVTRLQAAPGSHPESGDLSLLQSGDSTPLTSDDSVKRSWAVSADGAWVLYTASRHLYDSVSKKWVDWPRAERKPVVASDGRSFAYVAHPEEEVPLLELHVRRLGQPQSELVWSGDADQALGDPPQISAAFAGPQLLFTGAVNGERAVLMRDAASGALKTLAVGPGARFFASPSPSNGQFGTRFDVMRAVTFLAAAVGHGQQDAARPLMSAEFSELAVTLDELATGTTVEPSWLLASTTGLVQPKDYAHYAAASDMQALASTCHWVGFSFTHPGFAGVDTLEVAVAVDRSSARNWSNWKIKGIAGHVERGFAD